MKYKTEQMRSIYQNQSFDMEKDYDKDGKPDYLEVEQMERKLDIAEKEVALKALEVEQSVNQKNRDLDIKRQQSEAKMRADLIKAETDDKKIQSQERINKIKAAIMRNKSRK